MRTYVATYKIYTDYTIGKFFDVMSTKDVKYKNNQDIIDKWKIYPIHISSNPKNPNKEYTT